MLWGATVRSPHPYARIISIDATDAKTMPGVHAVLTHEDVPGRKVYGLIWTTTPWTIPANMAIAFNPKYEYVAVDVAGARRSQAICAC